MHYVGRFSTSGRGTNQSLKCHSGMSINGEGMFEEVTCTAAESSCQTRISQRGLFTVVHKRCAATTVCENNLRNNAISCSRDNKVLICHYCCSTDRCNTLERIPEMESNND
uniref:UPAR/Ly6 domain-containing protein n=1 Tax=Ciona savignyi TaxID=51511 RepID=H2YAJ2_CIOSA